MWALGARASVVAGCRLSTCGCQGLLFCRVWNLSGPGTEPMSPELAGRFLSTVPPGKSHKFVFKNVSPAAM